MAAAATVGKKSSQFRPFPADIEEEILLWLPVKTLIRFKCASESWYSLISSPQFQKHHYRRAQTKSPLLLTLHNEGRSYNKLDRDDGLTLRFTTFHSEEKTLIPLTQFSKTLPEPYSLPFTQSCLGLVCLFQKYSSLPVLICNPSTQDLISLPPTRGLNVSLGFGYSASIQEFKIVRIFWEDRYRCEVFTLGTSRWRKANKPPFPVDEGNAPFLHEAVHFLPHVSPMGVKHSDCISVFDINTEEFRNTIMLPPFYYTLGDSEGYSALVITKEFLRLSTLGASLCLAFDFGELIYDLDLWLLKDYTASKWVKAYSIDVSPLFPYATYGFWTYPADNVVGQSVLLNFFTQQGVKLLGYDPEAGTVILMDKEWGATFYVETFYALKILQRSKAIL